MRALRLFVCLFVLLVSAVASASTVKVTSWRWPYEPRQDWQKSAGLACSSGNTPTRSVSTVADGTAAGAHCVISFQDGSSEVAYLLTRLGCKFGDDMAYGATCPDDPPPCADTTNPFNRKFYYTGTPPMYTPEHYGNCKLAQNPELLSCAKDKTGTYCYWQFRQSGETWTGNEQAPLYGGNGKGTADESLPVATDTPATSPPLTNSAADPKICASCVPCPKGSTQMGIDAAGVPLCVGSGTTPASSTPKTPTTTTSPDVTTKNDDGSTTTTSTKTQQNADGSTTTTVTRTITQPDGTKTVSVDGSTSKNTAGDQGKQDTPDTDKTDFCKQNPGLSVCQNSTVAGTCGSITCTGDAIQCATLRATAAMQCQQKADVDALAKASYTATGNAVLSGADPVQADIDKNKAGTQVDVSNPGSAADESGFVGGGACIPDRTTTVMGKPVTIKFGYLCDKMSGLRAVILALAYLVFAYIVMGGIVSSGESSSV